MVREFYACLSREIQETDGEERVGLEFQVVNTSLLGCFLEGKANGRIMASKKYHEVFQNFIDYGITDERFRKVKVKYLGETGFQVVTVYFENMEFARYQYENWYLIRLSDDREYLEGNIFESAFYEWEETGDPVVNSCCNLEILPEEQAKLLKQLYHPYIPKESRAEGEERSRGLGVIGVGTNFGQVTFYYVGAALCLEMLDNFGNITAFFDLGTRISGNPALIAQQPAAVNSNAAIIANLGAIGPANQLTIFISHWHLDHCNALGAFVGPGGLAGNIAANTEWYVPGSASPAFLTIQAAVPPAAFHIYPIGAAQAPFNVNGNPNIETGKINFMGLAHPHHQGLYVNIHLVGGTNVFLPGDTTYQGIPAATRNNGGAGYDVLQACHHGGLYYPPAQAAALAVLSIPTPAAGAMAVYSADGIYHGHPNAFYVGHHRGQGYAAANEVCLNVNAAVGFNALFVV